MITDVSTLKDPLCQRAIFTYAAMRFGNPPNYDKLKEAYDTQKVQLMHATGYTDYGEETTEPETEEPETEPVTTEGDGE